MNGEKVVGGGESVGPGAVAVGGGGVKRGGSNSPPRIIGSFDTAHPIRGRSAYNHRAAAENAPPYRQEDLISTDQLDRMSQDSPKSSQPRSNYSGISEPRRN